MFRPCGECVLIDFGLSHHNAARSDAGRIPAASAPRPIWRRSGCWASATIRAATCFRSACCCISSPPACGRSARAKPCAGCGGGCGAIRIRRAVEGRTIRRGCRRSCCVVSRSSRSGAIPRRRNWRSIWASRPGQADRAIRAAQARSVATVLAAPLQWRPDSAAAEIRRRRRNSPRVRSSRSRSIPEGRAAERGAAHDGGASAGDAAVGAARLHQRAEARPHHHRPHAR